MRIPIKTRIKPSSFARLITSSSFTDPPGAITASIPFSAAISMPSAKGKNAFEDALQSIKPTIDKFIKENFKVSFSVAEIDQKSAAGEAVKILISGGSAVGLKAGTELKVFVVSSLMVEGKKVPRKKEIGKIQVTKVEDENFSICSVSAGGADIASKFADGASVKCEIINE